MASAREYRLRVGRVVLGLTCPDEEFAASMAVYFASESDPADPDVQLDLNLIMHRTDPAVPNSLIITKQLGPAGFDIADGLIHGRFDADTGTGELNVKTILTNGLMTRVFEQILYQAWHSARRRAGYDACLVHSAGVIHEGRGYLFVGASEAGKTTVARLSRDFRVVNDEMNVVEFGATGARLVGTPFNGHFRDKEPGEAPLAGVLLLAHAPDHSLEAVGGGEAASTVAGQIAPPVGLEDVAGPQTRIDMLETGARLVETVPVRRLNFRPDAGFWPLITECFTPRPRG